MSSTSTQSPNGAILFRGSCVCSRITYTISSDPPKYDPGLTNCHCQQCRKVSGSAYLTFLSIPTSSLTWSSEPEVLKLSEKADRGFCKDCGSSLYMRYHMQPERIGVCAGGLDSWDVARLPSGLAGLPMHDIWLCEKAGWMTGPSVEIDGVNKVERDDATFEEKLKAWANQRKR